MVDIIPFRGLRYARSDDLAEVVSPPFDVISSEQRADLVARSPHNIVAITLGPDAINTPEWYRQAAATKERWLETGVLCRDATPAFYGYRQEFVTARGTNLARTGFLARVRLSRWGKGIHPHERTREGPRADRLALMRAMRANTSPVFGLYHDPNGSIAAHIRPPSEPDAAFADADRVRHIFWRIADPGTLRHIVEAMAQHDVVIADGHHRYETALAYRDEQRADHGGATAARACDYVLMYLNAIQDAGLVVLPTHRIVRGPPTIDIHSLLGALGRDFEILRHQGNQTLEEAIAAPSDSKRMGVILPDGTRWVLKLRSTERAVRAAVGKTAEILATLDVSVLQNLVLEPHLGITPEVLAKSDRVTYTIDEAEALEQVVAGEAQAAFILNATPLSQVWEAAVAGVTMPQKSTYFAPKLLTGLVINPLDEL